MAQESPLAGLKVVDQTQALAGPYCAMILGDLGADVIKIERPGVGDQSRQWAPPYIGDQGCYYLAVNRNKRGIALNIRADEGREIMHKLAADADVFLTNLATSCLAAALRHRLRDAERAQSAADLCVDQRLWPDGPASGPTGL